MTFTEELITIAACIAGTVITRFLPFLVFSSGRPTPRYVQYLGKALPAAVFGMLILYCLKDVSFLSGWHGAPEMIAIAATAAVHLWRRNFLLSTAAGTICYMALVQTIFL